MPIEWRNLLGLTARELIGALLRDGFHFRAQSGSHQIYQHEDGRRVAVAYHRGGDTFPLGVLRKMIEREAKWTEADLRRLGLLD